MSRKRESHNMSKTTEWNIWINMQQRCYNTENPRYKDYGGRGIKVCDKWKNSFKSFYEDMGERPDGMTLDRIDNDGDYSLKNCRWASYRKQNLNKRIYKSNISGHKGIAWYKAGSCWRVQLRHKGKMYFGGYFVDINKAIKANNKLRKKVIL